MAIDLPDKLAMSVNENTAMAKYSYGPNFRAIVESGGARKISAKTLSKPPQNENTMPIPNAFPASPRLAIGDPSKQVATEEGVPGILIKIAEIRPPETPPTYKPINSEIAAVISMPKVSGMQSATAMVAVKPGMEPKIIPTTTPNTIRAITLNVRTEANPTTNISSIISS